MAKSIIITDTHFGVKNENEIYLQKYTEFLDDFFSFIERNGIKKLYHLGDLVDNRKHASPRLINWIVEHWFEPLNALGVEVYQIVGNHDTFYKNTNQPNWVDVLAKIGGGNYHVISNEIEYVGDVMLIPWVAPDIHDQIVSTIKTQGNDKIIMGHFDIQGMLMFGNTLSTHGFSQSMFNHAKLVLSGHYHKKSSSGNIEYLGSPLPFNWAEAFDPHGWHTFDEKTGKLAFHEWEHNLYGVYDNETYAEWKGEPFVRLQIDEDVGEVELKKIVAYIASDSVQIMKTNKTADTEEESDAHEVDSIIDVDSAIIEYIKQNYDDATIDAFKMIKEEA